MIVRASFRNFKVLRALEVALEPFTVIVGRNGSGKTSVLQGIHDVARVAAVGKSTKGKPWDDVFAIFKGAHAPSRLLNRLGNGSLGITLTDEDGMSLSLEATAGPDRRKGPHFEVEVTGTGRPREVSGEAANDAGLRDLLASREAARFGSAVFLRLDARVMVKESALRSEKPRLEHTGEGLASVLNYLAGARPDLLEKVVKDLDTVVPGVRGIRTFPVNIKRKHYQETPLGKQVLDVEGLGHRFALDMGPGRLIEADLLSEGTVLALGVLTVIHQPSCPRLVLMDDIDSALHSRAQAELVRCIRSIIGSRKDCQVVCTTHSPYLLDHVGLEEVRVMGLDQDGHAVCRSLADHPEAARFHRVLRTGEFWASVGEDWLLEGERDVAE